MDTEEQLITDHKALLNLPNTETPFWRDAYPPQSHFTQLTDDLQVDVIVVGAGITGLTAAYLLKQAGKNVVVLEKDTVGAGTTGRTTGKVTAQHELNYAKLCKRYGPNIAKLYGGANQAAIDTIEKIIQSESIACDWQRDDNFVFTDDAQKVTMFREEAKVAKSLGLLATFETKIPLPFKVKAAVKFSNQAKFHAQKYLLGLAKAVEGEGSHVFEHSEAIGIRDDETCRVRTSKADITAKNIIVATHVPTFPLIARVGYALLEYPTESFAIAGPYEGSLSGMYISPDNNHFSIQPMTISGEKILLVVGAGGNIPGFRRSMHRYKRLADYAQNNFNMTQITHKWSDMDYFAYDDLPLVGKVYPWSKNMYVATGFKKWGLTAGTIAGAVLCDEITGKDNDLTDIFDSQRIRPVLSIPRAVVSYIKNNVF